MFKNTFIATKLKVSAIITVIGLALLDILSYDKISNLQNDFKEYNSIIKLY
ncbi:MAG: hypothetical protein U9Q30_10275 [Campylobacterota bacterium]|nr:hypothetical protein [Campylobacterota bacterium]